MIIVNNIKLDINRPESAALEKAVKLIGLPRSRFADIWIHKVSLDARKGKMGFVYTVAADTQNSALEKKLQGKHRDIQIKTTPAAVFSKGDKPMSKPPVICGFGPAGLMCALVLARMGFKPIVLERGEDADSRQKTVKLFEEKGILNTESNIQFGEGGAGTFSDGKLTTRIHDPLCDFVSRTLTEHGAPQEILKKAKPHIGTDLLIDVIKNIRSEIVALGGRVYFNTSLTDIIIKDGNVTGVKTPGGHIDTDTLIIAAGHSARDLFFTLKEKGVFMTSKPFSVGVRIEHLQSEIEKGLYHDLAFHPLLPKGEYQLSYTQGRRGVYTFCMCPGGSVVAAASEEDTVVVNGMSNHARDGKNANSALVVSVTPEDFGGDFTKAIAFQRQLEKAAFTAGGSCYKAPCQTVDRFMAQKSGMNPGRVSPSYPLGVTEGDFAKILPDFVCENLRQALPILGRKLPGFDRPDSLLCGVETRTSSPVRILRGENFQSNIHGLYPVGEGAGYAGGIMSAAVDGVKIAQHICSLFFPDYE